MDRTSTRLRLIINIDGQDSQDIKNCSHNNFKNLSC